jgi:hypothetical protein
VPGPFWSAAAAAAEAKWPPVAMTMAARPRRRMISLMSAGVSQELSMWNVRALATARDLVSSRKIPRVPVVPDVVATVYRLRNFAPTSDVSATNDCVSSSVTAGSVTQSSKWAISAAFVVAGSSPGSVIRAGRP